MIAISKYDSLLQRLEKTRLHIVVIVEQVNPMAASQADGAVPITDSAFILDVFDSENLPLNFTAYAKFN